MRTTFIVITALVVDSLFVFSTTKTHVIVHLYRNPTSLIVVWGIVRKALKAVGSSQGPQCVECLIGKQKKPILFKVTEPSSIPYRTPSACAKRAAYPDPPPVIPVPDTGVAQVTTSPGRGLLAEQDRDD
jgi:hypothetical protein